MTYTELDNKIWNIDDKCCVKEERLRQAEIQGLEDDDRTAYRIIRALSGRKGFGHWWDEIDDEDKDEIFSELKQIIREKGQNEH
jgi:hypothetical protein